jgi:hypothetical protein
MLTYQAFFQQELLKLIDQEIERLKDSLIHGHNALDYPSYKHNVGIVQGLLRAKGLCEEAESIANGAESKRG